ncbi:MAG: molybdopterin molybdenumtransferase MoeA [Gemmatimonadetes bacterium]|nr:molybdopterin molybdotransferase MoeA [Gemmatimonadota bacterium]NIQ53219.1 molybdopterin molybdotransferase MoeA [Gemmatimonadota bacterium]NIU73365.1 molybdopterin molybdenumtransferase MoeA [Gammaproteobacteria bacterium]NIX43595.1 molybdopterin molybdenumtransferase MoeA [Gemmatimonadota bacterium]NIY07784.1 molybdopterin molybdenumtransferase MoeA [Gemmatimonadota bacterium]
MVVDWSGREADWLPVREAVERGLAGLEPLESEAVAVEDALGRVLAADVVSPVHQPPWDNSAMDGYAVRREDVAGAGPDTPVRLAVVDDIPAGGFPARAIGPGQAAKIMTGAPVPEGADSVIRVEHTDAGDEAVEIRDGSDAGRNIRRRGEDLADGELALRRGTAIGPAAMGVLAIVGMARPRVVRRPVVAILSNGDELVDLDEFDQVRDGRKIVNSNSYSLAGAVAAAGGIPRLLGIARDDAADIREKIRAGLDADVLLTSAGAATGEHDRVKDVLDELGYELDFWRVRMRPGSPASLGRIPRPGRRPLPVWGLPGNPVSALATFMVLARPALRRMLGRDRVHNAVFPVEAGERIPSKPDKTHFQRVILEPGDPVPRARPTGSQGSGILTSMTRADALFVVPEGRSGVEPGERGVALPLGPPDGAADEYGLPD